MRKAGVLDTRRGWRFVFYRLRDMKILTMIEMAASLTDLNDRELPPSSIRANWRTVAALNAHQR
ncbi:MAG: hypothetical protein MUO76_16045 [Anaerolineaceae bacterium]|nr:hypothetical protein [Anaerolineaceae bacterium]